MVSQYSDFQKFNDAKRIAKEHDCFIVERGTVDNRVYFLYRKGETRNFFLGERKTVQALLFLIKRACAVELSK